MAPSTGRTAGNAVLRLYHGQTNFDFINRWKIWFVCSGLVIVIGLISLGVGGLNFSIDFKGGSLWQVPTDASVATVRAHIDKISPLLGQSEIIQLTNQQTGKKNIQVEASSSITGNTALVDKVTDELANIAHVPTRDVNATLIGPSWGSSISKKAVEAVIVFLVLIAIAIAVYFETKMAIGALVALLHDILVTVGIYALSGFQVSPDTVIAFLTVMGYSIYDTIVVFDKVKENTKGLASTNRYTYTDVVNLSMNQVLARSVNTSFVAIMPVFCILVIGSWILGASALNDFGLALFIGLMSGAYSSIFIASPILALLKEREPRYVEIRRRLAAYPQSRQVITAAMVSGGNLVTARQASGAAPGLGVAGGTRAQEEPASTLGALTRASASGAGRASAERSAHASAAASAGTAAAWAELGDPSRDLGPGDGAKGRDGLNGEGAGGNGEQPGLSRLGGTGAAAAGKRPGAGAAKATGGRAVAPRPRKKAPRRR
ncbi:MAG TPA: protein translocase subunit SecF [Acidimicrobiales bacterium]|nr:protein translocase subunit SecF [Acidimicrobiales bacterium]